MWMWFHLTVDDIVLFDFWIVDNVLSEIKPNFFAINFMVY